MQSSTYPEKWVTFLCVKETLLLLFWLKDFLTCPSTVTVCVVKYRCTCDVSTHVESSKRKKHVLVSLSGFGLDKAQYLRNITHILKFHLKNSLRDIQDR